MGNIYSSIQKNNKKKQPIVFVHGDFQNSSVFDKLKKFFRKRGHTLLLFDLPGHGNSKQKRGDITSIISKLIQKNRLDKPIFVAHSSGGTFALEYLVKTGNSSGLILINAMLSSPEKMQSHMTKEGFEKYAKSTRKLFQKQKRINFSKIRIEETEKTKFKVTSPEGFENNFEQYCKFKDIDFRKIKVPILYIYSKKDSLIPLDYVKKRLTEPNFKIVEIDSTHNSILENPSAVLKEIKENYEFIFP